jgi:hypothetical protein
MTVILLTDPSVTSWTVPNDWNSSDNTVECIGAGQNGSGMSGGRGGDYARTANITLTPGDSIPVVIGQAGVIGGDSSFGSTMLAKGGGSASLSLGDVVQAGGNGAGPSGPPQRRSGGGGGGAGGLAGVGGDASGPSGGAAGGAPGGSGGSAPAVTGQGGASGVNYGGGGPGNAGYHAAPGAIKISYTPV